MPSKLHRRKPSKERRTNYLRVRLTEEQQQLIRNAAKYAGITVSAWTVERLLRAARAERDTESARVP